MHKYIIGISFFLLLVIQCKPSKETAQQGLFQEVAATESTITFNNRLIENDSMNFFTYSYLYLGGGVAVGDFNNDGWQDVFFTGNMVNNHLYLNQQNFHFKEVAQQAQVTGEGRWNMGCSVLDINADGLLDIYIAVAGKWASRKNILYVNQGVNEAGIPIFEDQAEAFGLADEGHSIQSTLLDYDQDGDLDLFVANYEPTPFAAISQDFKRLMNKVKWEQSDHLYRNNGDNTFTDVTQSAGLLNYGLTMGVIAADFNQDHLTDLYLSNDFHSPDRLYLNNGDATFKEVSKDCVQHNSFFGMGVDVADYNNDGLLDLMQVDMTPSDNFRSKANMAGMDVDGFWNMIGYDLHYQYMYNSLQTCQGIREDGLPFYAETAKLSNLDKTDWSWACLFGDYDNDGFKDLFVSNGTRRDINNKDFFKWLERVDISLKVKYKELSFLELNHKIPFQKIDNYIFKNQEGQSFRKNNDEWNLHFKGFSNGTAYADLDNDGDLELITNNIDSTASIFQNLAVETSNQNFVSIQLHGPKNNPQGIGTKIWIKTKEATQYHEHTLVRGYLSSIDERIHFGLGKTQEIEELTVRWTDGTIQKLNNIASNQLLHLDHSERSPAILEDQKLNPLFSSQTDAFKLAFTHQENKFDDFEREVLLPHQMSSFGPALATGDINKDGVKDVYIGGAKGHAGQLFLSQNTNNQISFISQKFDLYQEQEEVDALFFDPDQDGDLDLYIVTGGNEEAVDSPYYQDIFYENNGLGSFIPNDAFTDIATTSASKIVTGDYDQDGDLDILVTGRQIPAQYPSPADCHIYENLSTIENIEFQKVTSKIAPDLLKIGMATDAVWTDYDGDQDLDLIIVGEWMQPTFINNDDGYFAKDTQTTPNLVGWWNCIQQADFDEDGDMDYVLGNLGLNYKYKASQKETFDLYANDFDENGKKDVVLSYFQEGEQYPVRGMQCSSEQMPDLKKKFRNYNAFASANLEKIYTPQKLNQSQHERANEFAHIYLENKGNSHFEPNHLPLSTQISNINDILIKDFNNDNHLDLLMAGNLFDSEIETPRNDACYGWILLGDGEGNFKHLPYKKTGLYIPYETRQIDFIELEGQTLFLFANNNAPLQTFVMKKRSDKLVAKTSGW